MKSIIVGAGRGLRLMPNTADTPKCLQELNGVRIIDILINSLSYNNINNIIYIGGYKINKIKDVYNNLTYIHNKEWNNNNILESLMCAKNELNDDLIISYSDIIYTVHAVNKLLHTPGDVVLMIDTDWRTKYIGRMRHPESEAEKVSIVNGRISNAGKDIASDMCDGEFIGLMKLSKKGACLMKECYELIYNQYTSSKFHSAENIHRAYLTDMFKEMLSRNEIINYCKIEDYWAEIDTTEDLYNVQTSIPDIYFSQKP